MAQIDSFVSGHKKSINEFCSSHVSLIGANINDNTKLQIIWKCGTFEQSQICAIKKFAEYNDKSLGFDNLFPLSVVKHSKYIKVIFNICNKRNNFKSLTQINKKKTMNDNNTVNNNNKKKQIQTTLTQINKNKTMNDRVNNNKNNNKKKQIQTTLTQLQWNKNAPPLKKRKLWVRNFVWKLNSDLLVNGISQICDKLGKEDMFGMIPTIDCFSSNSNYQKICKKNITKKDNFFSSKYDNPSKWINEIAWCNPPYIQKIIIKTFNSFKQRKIRGYICTRYYCHQHSKYITQSWLFQLQNNKKCKSYINIGGKGEKNVYSIPFVCSFDTIILYFDFQQ